MSILEKTYLIDNIHYAITDEEAVHLRLMNDDDYLRNYIQHGKIEIRKFDDNLRMENKFIWQHKYIKLLLEEYKRRKDKFRDPTKKKSTLWQQIARVMSDEGASNITADMCDKKFRNLKMTYRKIQESNKKARVRINWEYYSDFLDIFLDDNVIITENDLNKNINIKSFIVHKSPMVKIEKIDTDSASIIIDEEQTTKYIEENCQTTEDRSTQTSAISISKFIRRRPKLCRSKNDIRALKIQNLKLQNELLELEIAKKKRLLDLEIEIKLETLKKVKDK